jgi:hypothetical protein
MNKLAVVSPPTEKFSWTTEILKVVVGGELKADVKHAAQIRQRLSMQVRLKEPDRVFETDTK